MRIRILSLLTILFTINAFCIDTTPFYRVALFQGETKRDVSDWTTYIDAQYAQGSTDDSWDHQEVKTCLFNSHGPFDLTMLSENLENLDCTPKTKAYHDGDIPKLYDGRTKFSGHFDIEEYAFTLQQNLFWGFYLQAYLPIRDVSIDGIDYSFCSTTASEQQKLANFIENDLDGILEEHCIEPLKTPYKKTSLSDCVLSLGWHGKTTFSDGILSDLRGTMEGGVIVPSGNDNETDRVFWVPIGYNNLWGVNARANIHATFWKKFVFGVNGGTSVFFDQSYDQRLTTSTAQNGLILLEHGVANVEQGQVWDIGGYIKAERIFGGLSVLAGYSYTQQEQTTLVLMDDCVMETAHKNHVVKNKDEVINSNKFLDKWYQHAAHFYAEYDFGAHIKKVGAPTLRASYNLPLLGKHSWPTEMWGGSLNIMLTWHW